MLGREEEAVQKLRQVIDFATNDDCKPLHLAQNIRPNTFILGLPHALAEYFGDEDGVPGGMCGQCTFCLSGSGVEFVPVAESTPDLNKIKAILDACPERDDARLLARMAFGITSPRLTYGKWSTSHPLFGSMDTVDFSALIEVFEEECKKAGYQSVAVAVAPTAKKRSYNSYQSSSSSYSKSGGSTRGRSGGKGKRGRYY